METEEQCKAREEYQRKDFERLVQDAKQKQKAREEWTKNHPPCPHCGKSDPFPFWFWWNP